MIPGSANPLLLASAAEDGAYAISRSLRFNSSDSAYLNRTPSTAGNQKTWTWSGWVKLWNYTTQSRALSTGTNSFGWDPDGRLRYTIAGEGHWPSTAVYRDPSAWYHLVVSCDTTRPTDFLIFYINGAESFRTNANFNQNSNTNINSTNTHFIGSNNASQLYSDFYLAEIHFIDGQALDPTSFGEFDTNGVWQPIEYTGSYGTNGFHLPFSDNSTAAALGTDTSGNGNDWTANNLTSSIDILPAVEFGGNSSDYLSIGNDSSLTFGSGDFTIEAWMNFDTAGSYTLVEKGSDWSLLSDNNRWVFKYGNTNSFVLSWTPTFGEWYHVACVRNGSTVTLYIDGQSIGSGPAYTSVADTGDLVIGTSARFSGYVFDGYVSNLRIVKGTALYTSNFTPPTTPLSAVTNTVLLCCQSSTDATDAAVTPGTITANGNVSATLKNDTSPDNDSFVDSPTNGTQTDTGVGGEVVGNYATLNPLDLGGTGCTLSNGNLEYSNASGNTGTSKSTIAMTSGKWYCECVPTLNGDISLPGILNKSNGDNYTYYAFTGNSFYIPGSGGLSQAAYGASYSNNDVVGIAYDADSGDLTFYKNGTSQGVISTGFGGDLVVYYFSDGSSNALVEGTVNFGQRPFAYAAPSGYKALCTANLPAPVVTKPSEYMDVVTYTGTAASKTITNLDFSPDFVWIKDRSAAYNHGLFDIVRGANKRLSSSTSASETTYTQSLMSFDSNGFTLGDNSDGNNTVNISGDAYVAWTWDAGDSTVTNTDGSITSQVRANPSAGFSIVTWTPQATAGTLGHGLGVAPAMIITKDRDATFGWFTYHSAIGTGKYLVLNLTDAATTNSTVFSTAPTSTVFDQGTGFTSAVYEDQVCYCFAPVEGYSAFGSYTGNGSADGPFVYTGFRPRWLMIKNASASGTSWVLHDTERDPDNIVNHTLLADSSGAEGTPDRLDILSNGFKIRSTAASYNGSTNTLVYACFAESPLSIARAR